MRRHYNIQSYLHQSTVGAAIEWDSYVVGGQDPTERGYTNGFFGSFALTYDGAAPGVNIPFSYSLFSIQATTPQAHYKKRRHHQVLQANKAPDGIFIGLPIEDAPPDTTPLLNAHVLIEYPCAAYAARKRNSLLRAGFPSVKSIDPNITPATSYAGDSCELLSEIQAHMLESTIDGGLTWSLWTAEEVLSFLNERLAKFMDQTHLIEKDAMITTVAGIYDYDLPSDLIHIERVAYLQAGAYSILPPIEKFTLDNGSPGWQTATGTPLYYIEEPLESLTARITPIPATVGTILLRYVPQHSTVGAVCVPLEIPSMFVPCIKYGVMADMLSKEGEANDPLRAEYCEDRFTEGLDLAKLMMGKV